MQNDHEEDVDSVEASSSEEEVLVDDDLRPELTLTIFHKTMFQQALQTKAKKQFLKILKNYDWEDIESLDS